MGETMGKLLETLGFIDNPFASYVAENEPEIDQYFIRPPYYRRCYFSNT